jgi:ankyrin repeat protein
MGKHILLKPSLHSLSLSAVAAVMVALSFGSVAFCGEIHEASWRGDLGKVKALLDVNPNLVFSKDHNGRTPLH